MAAQPCTCSVLKHENEALKTTIEDLLAENVRLQIENGKFNLIISEMGLPLESEQSEGSATNSVGEDDDDDVIGDDCEDGIELKMVDGVFHMEDECGPASQTREKVTSSSMRRSDESIWGLNGSWRCAVCQKKIRGDRRNRLKHIVVHKRFKFACPFNDCKKQLNLWSFKYDHIPRLHNMKHEQLSEDQKNHLRNGEVKLTMEAKKFEREFFPKANFCEEFKLKNEICRTCGAKVSSQRGQRDHVAVHLHIQLACPVAECNKRTGQLASMYRHLRDAHSELPMSGELQEQWEQATKAYYNAVTEAKNLYF